MPIERFPGRTLSTAIQGLQDTTRAQELGKATLQNGITMEPIEAVLANGSYRIGGRVNRELTTTGNPYGLLAGMVVAVAWQNGEPTAILSHSARRAQFVPPLGAVKFPVVEELFLPDGGTDRRVWFRNGTDLRPILFDPHSTDAVVIGGVVVLPESVFWGRVSPDHFVVTGVIDSNGHPFVAVYSIGRPRPNEPFPPGFRIKPKLLRVYDLADPAGPVFGTISVSGLAGSNSNPLRVFSSAGVTNNNVIITGPSGPTSIAMTHSALTRNMRSGNLGQGRYAGVAPNGDLLCAFAIEGSSLLNAGLGHTVLISYTVGSLLVNFTRGTVLKSHAPDLGVPLFIRFGDGSIPNPFFCASAGTVVTSSGHNLDSGERGDVTLLSAKIVEEVPTVNNYLLVEHQDRDAAGTNTDELCYPGGGSVYTAAVFRVLGEFAQVIATLPAGTIATAQRPWFQASRTHVFWANTADFAYVTPLTLFATDLKETLTEQVGEDPQAVLLLPALSIPQYPTRQMVAVRSGLIYAPQGPSEAVPPDPTYNVQFFVKGTVKLGPNHLDQAALEKNAGLQSVANLKKAKTDAEAAIVQVEDADLQSLNSQALGPARTASSL